MRTSKQINAEISGCFGFVPPFFTPAQQTPEVLENLWQQTLIAYVNNPLSPLFKEKLFANLSRYYAVPYCMICHSCSLHSLGIRGREVLDLLESPPSTETDIGEHLRVLALAPGGLRVLPPNSVLEESLLYCAIFIALEQDKAEYCRRELRRLLGPVNYQHLVTLIAYVRTCQVWIEAHPEVAYEADKRTIDHLDALLEEEPNLADFFQNYVERVRRERQSWAERVATNTERKRDQQALRQSEEHFRLLVEGVRDYAIFMLDPNGHIASWNAGAESIKGYQANEIIGQHFSRFYSHEDIKENKPNRELQVATAVGRFEEEGWRLRKDGSRFWANVVISALRDEAGTLQGFAKVTRDITERKRAQEQILASLQEKEVLLKEIHHRVKNNLQVISSLFNRQRRFIKDQQTLAILRESQNRIESMALVHEQLYQSKNLSRIDLAEYIRNLVANLSCYYDFSANAIAIKINVDRVFLGIEAAISCALIVNELVTNSLKYAFAAGKSGEICIEVSSDNARKITLVVRDNGVGFPKDLDFRNTKSLGLQLVNDLTEQLEGTIELNNHSGTEFKITFNTDNQREIAAGVTTPAETKMDKELNYL